MESFASEPVGLYNINNTTNIEVEQSNTPATYAYKGFSGTGFVETATTVNSSLSIPVEIEATGWYAIDIRYANGNGPVNTENKCAIRTLRLDSKNIGVQVYPQRGKDEWSNWGYSNTILTLITKGKHILTISLEKENANMNLDINAAMLDLVRFTKLK